MNPATFASPPGGCALGTQGSFGPDRITRATYDTAGHVTQQQSAYGTSLAQTTAAYTYTNNGKVATLTDARNYRTTYEYDGFDRLMKQDYPYPNSTNQSRPSAAAAAPPSTTPTTTWVASHRATPPAPNLTLVTLTICSAARPP